MTLPTKDIRPIQVLVAEDEESFVDALVVGLEREGFAVTVARDGNEALALFKEHEFDLLLLDVMLPRMSGLDTLRHLVQIDPRVAVLLSSGYSPDQLPDVGSFLAAVESFLEELVDDEQAA